MSPVKTTFVINQSASTASAVSAAKRSSMAGEFGHTAMVAEESTTTRVRQRISRELIRETVQQRIAEGRLSRKPLTVEPTRPPSVDSAAQIRIEKDLPPPPSDSIPMTKTHTTDASTRQASDGRPKMRARSQTQSAHQVLKATERDGVIAEPKSALDKLIQISGPATARTVSTSSVMPVSILQKPKETLLPPAALYTPTLQGGGMAAREQAINAKRREKEGRATSSTSAASSSSSKGRRRSLSVSDAGEGPEAVSILL